MNAKERLDAFFQGESVDRVPNLTIVGSVVTQYTGIDIEVYSKDYKAMTRSAIEAANDLKLDFVQIASDLCREAEGYGSVVEYSPTILPTVKELAIKDASEISKLKVRKASDIPRMVDLIDATALALKEEPNIYPMTLAVGPTSVVGNMRGLTAMIKDMRKNGEALDELMAKVTETTVDFIKELAGVALSMFILQIQQHH